MLDIFVMCCSQTQLYFRRNRSGKKRNHKIDERECSNVCREYTNEHELLYENGGEALTSCVHVYIQTFT